MTSARIHQTGWLKKLWQAIQLGIVLLTPLWICGTTLAAHEKLRPYLPNPALERGITRVAVAVSIVAIVGLAAVLAVWRDNPGWRLLDARHMGALSRRLMRATVIGQYAAIAIAVTAIIPVLRHESHDVRVTTTWAFFGMIAATLPVAGISHYWMSRELRDSYKEMLARR